MIERLTLVLILTASLVEGKPKAGFAKRLVCNLVNNTAQYKKCRFVMHLRVDYIFEIKIPPSIRSVSYFQDTVLSKTNGYRALHNADALTWDATLAARAGDCCRQITESGKLQHCEGQGQTSANP